jgi:hypothetical protein
VIVAVVAVVNSSTGNQKSAEVVTAAAATTPLGCAVGNVRCLHNAVFKRYCHLDISGLPDAAPLRTKTQTTWGYTVDNPRATVRDFTDGTGHEFAVFQSGCLLYVSDRDWTTLTGPGSPSKLPSYLR